MNRAIHSLAKAVTTWSEWVERRPKLAWWSVFAVVLATIAWEAAYWPLHDYPSATWHNADRGIDVDACQAGAARAGWPELWGFWRGRYIDGNPTFRPLAAWLFVAEYHLFGREDRLWCGVSIGLHLLAMAGLFWSAGRISGGSPARRLTVGALSVLIAAGPRAADLPARQWVLSWWPSQPDPLSLTCALLLLAGVAEYARGGTRKWAALAVGAFLLGITFKETIYVAGLGGCLLGLRRRRAWSLVAGLAAIGLAGFAYRSFLYQGEGAHSSENIARLIRTIEAYGPALWGAGLAAWPHLLFGGLGVGVARLWRRAGRPQSEATLVGGVAYLLPAVGLLGFPTETMFQVGLHALISAVVGLALLVGLARAWRDWPAPELTFLTLAVVALCWGFPPTLAWHRYWSGAFTALLSAVAIGGLADQYLAHLRQAPPARQDAPSHPEVNQRRR